MTYIPALDRIRGTAIVAVMFFHFGSAVPAIATPDRWFAAMTRVGWLGVDLFFVLSGFLITRILLGLRSPSARGTNVRRFYIRRALRIFPIYYFALALWFAGWHLGLIDFLPLTLIDWIEKWGWTYPFYVQNLAEFGTDFAPSGGLGHFWSLAIEEQFYLVWPWVVLYGSRRTVLVVALIGAVAPLLLRWQMSAAGFSAHQMYVFTLCRVDTLMLGALAAMWIEKRGSTKPPWLAARWLTLLVPAVAMVLDPGPWSEGWLLTLGQSAFAVGAACWIAHAVMTEPAGSSARSTDLLATFGRYSYAIYVWHVGVRFGLLRLSPEPVAVAGSHLPWQLGFVAIAIAVSLGLGYLSWILIESRWLIHKRRFSYVREQSC